MVTCLIIPGLHDSGPDHWQTRWLACREDCVRVELGRWSEPSRTLWMSRLDRAIARASTPVVLVAHSLGCQAVVSWASEASAPRLEKVRGALLVAPPDVDGADTPAVLASFAPTPERALPFRSILAASRDDHYATFQRSRWMAARWGCEFADFGRQGHLNAESRLGDWIDGQQLLRALIRREPIGADQAQGAPSGLSANPSGARPG
jgi:predicted alpha/beta hydrolase family esterase